MPRCVVAHIVKTDPYEELVAGVYWLRHPPGERHERICRKLHASVAAVLEAVSELQRLEVRELIQLRPGIEVRPDLTLVERETGQPWLVAEVVNRDDHRPDTVVKKAIYEEIQVPRLWMIDPRYDNVEVYARNEYGLALGRILALRDVLDEPRLPGFNVSMEELFGG